MSLLRDVTMSWHLLNSFSACTTRPDKPHEGPLVVFLYDDESNRAAQQMRSIKTSPDGVAASKSNFVLHQMFGFSTLVDYRWFTCSRLSLSSWVWGMENMMMNISIKIIDLGRLFVGDTMITKFYLSIKSFSRNIQDADDFLDVIFESIALLIVSWWKKFFLSFMIHDS